VWVDQVVIAPVARLTTRIPLYWQPFCPQFHWAVIASLLPSGDRATSSMAIVGGTCTGSLVTLMDRPLALTCNRNSQTMPSALA
jgi:hypothetical protein